MLGPTDQQLAEETARQDDDREDRQQRESLKGGWDGELRSEGVSLWAGSGETPQQRSLSQVWETPFNIRADVRTQRSKVWPKQRS